MHLKENSHASNLVFKILLSPQAAAKGGIEAQFSLAGFSPARILASPERQFTSHKVELWQHTDGRKLVVKSVASGLESTLAADIIGQRFFNLLQLPTPQTSLIEHEGQYKLVMEFLDGYHESAYPLHLPPGQDTNETIQRGVVADIWLNHYDRQPYNFMFKGNDAVFIDFGGCLTSSPSGKLKGLAFIVDEAQIYRNLKAFQGPVEVNEAYGRVLKIDPNTHSFKILKPEFVAELASQLSQVRDEHIEAVVEGNSLKEQKKNPARLESIIAALQDSVQIPIEKLHYAHHHDNFKQALETFTLIRDRFDSDESVFLVAALKARRDSLVAYFS